MLFLQHRSHPYSSRNLRLQQRTHHERQRSVPDLRFHLFDLQRIRLQPVHILQNQRSPQRRILPMRFRLQWNCRRKLFPNNLYRSLRHLRSYRLMPHLRLQRCDGRSRYLSMHCRILSKFNRMPAMLPDLQHMHGRTLLDVQLLLRKRCPQQRHLHLPIRSISRLKRQNLQQLQEQLRHLLL